MKKPIVIVMFAVEFDALDQAAKFANGWSQKLSDANPHSYQVLVECSTDDPQAAEIAKTKPHAKGCECNTCIPRPAPSGKAWN